MIFPKKQMKIEQETSIQIKKQALQLIISLYLTRKKDEDVQFLKNNFRTTEQLVTGIRSSITHGLSEPNIQLNRIVYGQNQKKLPQKCLSFLQCLKKQLLTLFFIISFAFLISSLIYGKIKKQAQIDSSASILLISQGIITFSRVLIEYIWSYRLQKNSLQKIKSNLYQVLRNGQQIQIQQSEIVVGDIIQLGFHQKVPATGIIISSSQVFVKQNPKNPQALSKINLESCLKKIQNMTMLDLKLSFQNSSQPSPIILRGSELLKGGQYSIVVISVTEQNLLQQLKIDQFSSDKYDSWAENLIKNWKKLSIHLISLTFVILLFNKIAEINLSNKNLQKSLQTIFKLLIQVSVLIIVLDVNQFAAFLYITFIKFVNSLKTISKFEDLFTIKRILCSQRKIIQHDEIVVKQLAICDRPDLISLPELKSLCDPFSKTLLQVEDLFNLTIQNKQKKQKQPLNHITHINKRNLKIVSIFSQSRPQINNFSEIFKQIANIAESKSHKTNEHKTIVQKKKQLQKQKCGSFNCLKIPQITNNIKPEQNLKQIIHSKCRIKSRSLIDGLVGIAVNGLRTYYFQIFDMKNIQEINFIIQNGKVTLFTDDHKQKMVMLARKMNLIYNLTPILIAFNDGSYNQKPARTLVCIFGVNIIPKYELIQKMNQLERYGISSTIFIGSHASKLKPASQQQIVKQYQNLKWIDQKSKNKIWQATQLRNLLNRLVCRKCRISNCQCTQKTQQIADIQPFIDKSSGIKIIHNTDDQSLRYIKSAYKQTQKSIICIKQNNQSAVDIIDAIFSCIDFIQSLKRTVVLFYVITAIFFVVPALYWTRGYYIIDPLQIGVSYLLMVFVLLFGFLGKVKCTNHSAASSDKKQIKIITKQQKFYLYTIMFFVFVVSWLFYFLHYLIPQYPDYYDTLIKIHKLDETVCKYGPNNSVTIQFEIQHCSTPELGLQYSRFSTILVSYLYAVAWMLVVIVHHNLKSIRAISVYIVCIGGYFLILQFAPQILHVYSYGLHWQHYLLIFTSACITLLVGYFFGFLLTKIPIIKYFDEEMQSSIILNDGNKSNYIQRLKKYNNQKKKEKYNLKQQIFRQQEIYSS